MRPRLADLRERSAAITVDPAALLRDVAGITADRARPFLDEAAAVTRALDERTRAGPLAFPREWAASTATGELLYAWVRGGAPEFVLETGVANGVSSSYLLEALERNGHGALHSFDIEPKAGQLVDARLRARWRFHVLPPRRSDEELRRVLSELPPVELAFLDADHSYSGQAREYELVRARMGQGGWLISDDVDWSFAFLELAERLRRPPSFLVTESKVVGVLRVSS